MRGLYLHKPFAFYLISKYFAQQVKPSTKRNFSVILFNTENGKRSLKNCVQLALILGNVNGVLFLSGCLMKMFIFVRCKSDKTTKPCNQIVLQHLGVFSKYLLFFLFFFFFFFFLSPPSLWRTFERRMFSGKKAIFFIPGKSILAVQLFKGVIDYKLMTK